jgi:tetratricopeptide (TPR) repeat protein
LDKEKAELIREKNDLKRDLEAYRPLLEQLQNNTNKIDNFEGRLETSKKETLNNFNLLIRSMQDLSLKNYEQAHESAITLLESSPDNTEALYIAGWLELQFVKGPNNEELLDSGIDRLKQACDLMPKSAAFMAALAVGYRRKARKFSKETNLAAFKDYMREAKKLLEKALEGNQVDNFSGNSTLIDLNGESFYGPLAACYRDLGDSEADFDKAIHYYTEATKLTPLSSYPSGNLAALYLETKQYKEALERFFKTIASARLEISSNARDYYAMMDAAMSFTMLGDFRALRQHLKKDAERIIKTLEGDSSVQDAAQILLDRDEWFNLALNAVKTKETLDVSLGGWERLLKATPDDWTVRQAIEDCMAKIKAKKETL